MTKQKLNLKCMISIKCMYLYFYIILISMLKIRIKKIINTLIVITYLFIPFKMVIIFNNFKYNNEIYHI